MPPEVEPWMYKAGSEVLNMVGVVPTERIYEKAAVIIATTYAAREQSGELRRAAQALIEKVEAAQSIGREIAVLKSALAGEA